MYKNFLHPDIQVKILSNYPFYLADIEKDFEKFKERLKNYDVGIFVMQKNINFKNVRVFNSLGQELSWEDVVLNYLKSLNTFLREQLGVIIEKNIPKIIDNELTYLIIRRKNSKEFSDIFFIAIDGEVIFPMINKEFDMNLAIIKLVEWQKRAKIKNLIKFQ